MKQLIQDLKAQTFKPVYLLYGDEEYLKKQYRDKLREVLKPDNDTMNISVFTGKDTNCNEVIDLAETMPFMSEHRLIILEDTGFFKAGGEKLSEYLTQLSPTVYFIFVESQIDKRSKLFKTVKSQGRTCEFARQDEQTLIRWILTLVKKEGKEMSTETVSFFLEKTGDDMLNIKSELEKLFCFTLKKNEITRDDISQVCIQHLNNRIFEMVSAIAEKKQKQALEMYRELLSLKESPMGILALITRQFNYMLQIHELMKKNLSQKVIGDKIGMSPYIVQKYAKQLHSYTTESIRRALDACVRADEDVKTGKIADVLSLELLIIECSNHS